MNPGAFPVLQTRRLTLRAIGDEDVHEIYLHRSDPELMRFIPRPRAQNHEDALKLIRDIRLGIQKSEKLVWGITLKNENRIIGTAGFVHRQPEHYRAEIGYMLSKEHHGMGYMKEALTAIVQYGFEHLHLHSMEAIIDPENLASEAVLKSFGFEKEAWFRENFFFEGRFLDSVHYTLLKSRFSIQGESDHNKT